MSISGPRRRVVVQLAPSGEGSESIAASIAAHVRNGRLIRVSRRGRAVIDLPPDADPATVAAELEADPRVVYAEPDVIDTAQATPKN